MMIIIGYQIQKIQKLITIMTKQFYTYLGEQLCSIKNGPFRRLGQQKQQDLNNLQQKSTLAYDGDRLFNPDKYKEKESFRDQSIIDFKKDQKEQMFKFQYNLLKRNTNQEYAKQIEKMKQMRMFDHKQPYTWFGVYRGACLLCGKCGEYEGCFSFSQKFAMNSRQFIQNAFNSNTNSNIEIMQCYKCKCPMNSHVAVNYTPTLRNELYKNLINKDIQDNFLKFNHIILAFKVPEENISHFHALIQILTNLNCPVINYKIQTKLNFELSLIKSTVIQNCNTEKSYMESLLSLIQSIKMEKQWKWTQNKNYMTEFYEDLYNTIKKLGIKLQNQLQIGEKQCVLVLLCQYQLENVKNLVRYLSMNDQVAHENYYIQRSVSTQASSVSSSRNSRNRGNPQIYMQSLQQNQIQQLQKKHKMKFIYSTFTRKQSIILSQYFFRQNYQINYNIFMLPSGSIASGTGGTGLDKKQMDFNSARFKDILDYNGYIIFLENVKEIERAKLEDIFVNVLGYRSIKVNYILGQELLNEKIKKLSLKLTVKVGIPGLSIPFENAPDFITVKNTSKMEIPRLLKIIYPEFNYSQRCVFIIRPFVLNSNFQEVIVNLLRINNFILLKRVSIKLSESQAAYLATIQKIPQHIIEDYIKYMTAGVCEIILTSKRGAIYEAYALAHGCLNGISDIVTKSLKNLSGTSNKNSISIQTKRNRDIFQQQLPIFSNCHQKRSIHNPNSSTQLFKSVRELIDIQKVLFGYNAPTQYTTNTRNGQITKLDSNTQNKKSNAIQVSHKIKQSLLKELKKENYNYWLFTSLSQTLTQQIASIFLPQCTLFEPVTVLVKPGLIHLIPLIRKSLLEHKYHIIVQKQIQMNRQSAKQFVFNCQKIKIPSETMKYIIDTYCKQKVYIFCLSKISGRKQITSMLSGFTFLTNLSNDLIKSESSTQEKGSFKSAISTFIEDEQLSDQLLCDMLVPVWNNQQLCLRMIAQPLANLEENIHLIYDSFVNQGQGPISNKNSLKKYQKFMVLDYLVGSFYGVSITDMDLNSSLGKLTLYLTQVFEVPKLQSWYYSKISHIKPNYVPLLFQYRIIGGQTMVCIQSDKGVPFMEMIEKMYLQQQQKIKASQLRQQNNFSLRPIVKKQKRRSLVLFLFGKKLAQLCLDLSQVETQLKDFGQIVMKNSEYRGISSLEQAQKQQLGFLNRLLNNLESQKDISHNIKKLINSRHQKQRYSAYNKRLIPSFTLSNLKQCIRVIQKTQTSKLNLMDKYQFIDPENQSNKLKDLYSLHLFNIFPQIKTKYSMVGQIYYFFIKNQFQNIENGELTQMMSQIQQIFSDMLTQVSDLDAIQYQIYLRFLIQFFRMEDDDPFKGRLVNILKSYPNLKKNKKIDRDEIAGKKRKFLDHNQYFKRNNQQNQQVRQVVEKKYLNFDLNSLNEELKPNALYDPKDPLHYQFAHTQNRVNLLREAKSQQQRKGVYVQFEKNITQKEELLKQKIRMQAQRFNYQKDQILYETGLQKQLWYRRQKGEQKQTPSSKTNIAIQKQIEKLLSFKELQKKK